MSKEVSDIRDINGAPVLLRGGMRMVLYQCTECGEVEETSGSHVHRITSEGGHSFYTRHYPKRKLNVLIERAAREPIR